MLQILQVVQLDFVWANLINRVASRIRIPIGFPIPDRGSFFKHIHLEFFLPPKKFVPLVLDFLQFPGPLLLHLLEPLFVFLHEVHLWCIRRSAVGRLLTLKHD